LELGNEINGPFFNGDFLPSLATGRVLGLSDLDNPQDPEGQAIAASYRAYLSLLAVLKDVRDHSKVNRKTPIITAGMGDGGLPGKRPGKLDGVSIPATFAFLRRNGMDKLVDGYGVHVYPSGDLRRSASTRTDDLEQDAFALCTAAKPCWLTEWGWGNPDQSCPLNDKTRAQLIQLERKAFEPFVKQGRLAAILFYMWSGLPGAKSEDPAAIFRCGTLTDAGKLALGPMGTHEIISQATGLCFNINGNTNNSGEAIIPYPCGSSTNMEFNFVDQGSEFYSIHTVNGTQDLCLNISTAAPSPGDGKKYGGPGNLIQWSCGSGSSPSDNELFKLVDLGGGRQQIRVKNSGLCLEDPGRGGTIRQNVCSSSPNQTFTLTE
jgi:hypothetical protein